MNKIYLTSNVAEEIHTKINNLLPKPTNNKYVFIKDMRNILG